MGKWGGWDMWVSGEDREGGWELWAIWETQRLI